MSKFTDIMLSEAYLKVYTAGKAIIFTEDQDDIYFWTKIFDSKSKGYKIFPIVKYANANGKVELLKLIPKLNNHLFIAVDSDFDYICREKSKILNNNFIFHTYLYSKESYEYDEKNILNIINKIFYQNAINHNYSDFILEYSKNCFSVLCCITFMINSNIKFNRKKFENFIKFSSGEKFYTDGFNNLAVKKTADLNKFLTTFSTIIDFESNEYLSHVLYLKSLGINELNAYKFINGHILEKTINKFLKEYKSYVQNYEIKYSETIYPVGQPRTQEINKIIKHFSENCSISTFVKRFDLDWSCMFMQNIYNDLTRI